MTDRQPLTEPRPRRLPLSVLLSQPVKSHHYYAQFPDTEAEAQAGQGLPLDHIGSKYWLQTPPFRWMPYSFLREGTSGPNDVPLTAPPHPTPQNCNSCM